MAKRVSPSEARKAEKAPKPRLDTLALRSAAEDSTADFVAGAILRLDVSLDIMQDHLGTIAHVAENNGWTVDLGTAIERLEGIDDSLKSIRDDLRDREDHLKGIEAALVEIAELMRAREHREGLGR